MKERSARVKTIEARDELREGMYRVTDDGKVRWYVVWIEFYPQDRWMVKEVDSPLMPTEIEGSRGKLSTELRSKLEPWL